MSDGPLPLSFLFWFYWSKTNVPNFFSGSPTQNRPVASEPKNAVAHIYSIGWRKIMISTINVDLDED